MEDDKIIKTLDMMKLYKKEGYDYLLNMSFKSITKTNIKKLEEKINYLKKELNKLNKLTSKDMWLEELNNI